MLRKTSNSNDKTKEVSLTYRLFEIQHCFMFLLLARIPEEFALSRMSNLIGETLFG